MANLTVPDRSSALAKLGVDPISCLFFSDSLVITASPEDHSILATTKIVGSTIFALSIFASAPTVSLVALLYSCFKVKEVLSSIYLDAGEAAIPVLAEVVPGGASSEFPGNKHQEELPDPEDVADWLGDKLDEARWALFVVEFKADKRKALQELVKRLGTQEEAFIGKFGLEAGKSVWGMVGGKAETALPSLVAAPQEYIPEAKATDLKPKSSTVEGFLRELALSPASTLWIGGTGAGKTSSMYAALRALSDRFGDLNISVISQKNDSFLGAREAGRLFQFKSWNPEIALDEIVRVSNILQERLDLEEDERSDLEPILLILDDWLSIAGTLNSKALSKNSAIKASDWQNRLLQILTVGRAYKVKFWASLQSYNLKAIGIESLDSQLRQNFNVWIQGNISLDSDGGLMDSTDVLSVCMGLESVIPSFADRAKIGLELPAILRKISAEQQPAAYSSVHKSLFMVPDLRDPNGKSLSFKAIRTPIFTAPSAVSTISLRAAEVAPKISKPATPFESRRDEAIVRGKKILEMNKKLWVCDLAAATGLSTAEAQAICQLIAYREKAHFDNVKDLVTSPIEEKL